MNFIKLKIDSLFIDLSVIRRFDLHNINFQVIFNALKIVYKKFTNLNFIFVFFILVIYQPLFNYFINLNQTGGHSFLTADWLISYNFGFINKGMFGSLLFYLFKTPTKILIYLPNILISFYIAIFIMLYFILTNYKQNFLSYILLVLPSTFLFNIYDSQGAFRKELLGIISLFLVANRVIYKSNYLIIGSSIFYLIGIFSHSVNLFFLPTILIILFFFINEKHFFNSIFFLIPTLLNLSSFFLFSNSENDLKNKADLMCRQISEFNLNNLCGHGSFEYLKWDLNAAYKITQNYIINLNRDISFIYIFLFILSFLPFLCDKNILKNIKYYFSIGFLFIPLFLIGYDWGRWIYIMSICFLVIYLISEKHKTNQFFVYLLIFYPFLFKIQHCCNPTIEIEFFSIFNNLHLIFNSFVYLLKLF